MAAWIFLNHELAVMSIEFTSAQYDLAASYVCIRVCLCFHDCLFFSNVWNHDSGRLRCTLGLREKKTCLLVTYVAYGVYYRERKPFAFAFVVFFPTFWIEVPRTDMSFFGTALPPLRVLWKPISIYQRLTSCCIAACSHDYNLPVGTPPRHTASVLSLYPCRHYDGHLEFQAPGRIYESCLILAQSALAMVRDELVDI